jgi:type II secretory pathway pseudopilin PulG
MKKHMTAEQGSHRKPGFTLVEIAIAIGMMAVMISSFMVVFGPAIQGIDKSLSAKEADRLASALEHELSVVRAGENDNDPLTLDKFATSFEKAFLWIKRGNLDDKNPVLIYQYRGDPATVRPDGTLAPYTLAMAETYKSNNDDEPPSPGKQYVIQTSVRRLNDAFHTAKIQAELAPGVLEGKVYYVRMTQLRYNTTGELVDTTAPNNITQLYPPHANTATPASYIYDAVLPFKASFHEVKPVLWSYVNNTWSVNNRGDAVFTRNMAVTR